MTSEAWFSYRQVAKRGKYREEPESITRNLWEEAKHVGFTISHQIDRGDCLVFCCNGERQQTDEQKRKHHAYDFLFSHYQFRPVPFLSMLIGVYKRIFSFYDGMTEEKKSDIE